jgi:hypothetical protein
MWRDFSPGCRFVVSVGLQRRRESLREPLLALHGVIQRFLLTDDHVAQLLQTAFQVRDPDFNIIETRLIGHGASRRMRQASLARRIVCRAVLRIRRRGDLLRLLLLRLHRSVLRRRRLLCRRIRFAMGGSVPGGRAGRFVG